MKNNVIEKKLIDFIRENNTYPSLYWAPLIKLKRELPVIAYDIDEIYKNNDIDMLDNLFKKCNIREVNTFHMDYREYFEGDSIHDLLYESDKDGYNFPWGVETFYFDRTAEWLIYVSHEGTISFTGKKLVEASKELFAGKYELRCAFANT